MKKAILAIGAVITACAVCCIPLFIPALAGASVFGAGLFSGPLSLETVLCALAPAALAAIAVFFGLKMARRKKAACGNAACEPSGKCGCKTP